MLDLVPQSNQSHFFLSLNFLHSCFKLLYFLWRFFFFLILERLFTEFLNGSPIKAVFNFFRIASNTSFMAAFFNVFCSDVSINLVTGSARTKYFCLFCSSVSRCFLFHDFYYFFYAHHSLKNFLIKSNCRLLLISFLLPLFHINKRNRVYSVSCNESFWYITWMTQIENKIR